MNRIERILVNVSSNWLGFAINAIITLLLTPFVLDHLGISRYGVWVLITSFIGSYSLLDLGFRAGVNQFMIRSLAASDFRKASTVLNSSLIALSCLGILVLAATAAAAFIIPGYMDVPAQTRGEARVCILIVGTAAAIQISLSPFASVFVAAQRFDLANLIGVSMRLLSAIGIVVLLRNGFGLIGVAWATASTTVVGYLLRWIIALRIVPRLRVSLRDLDVTQLRGIGSFGLWNFLISVSEYAYLHLLPILVAVSMPVAAVGHYALAAGLWQQLNSLFSPIGQVMYPAAAELLVKRESVKLQRLYADGTRMFLMVVVSVVLVAFIWAEDFYRLWIGKEYLDGEPFVSVATLFRAMLAGTLLAFSANIAGQLLMGAGHIRSLALLKVLSVGITLTLTLLFIGKLGLIAIPVATAAAILVADVIGVPIALRRKEGFAISVFKRFGGVRVLAASGALALLLYGVHASWPVTGWFVLLSQAAVAGLCIVAVALTIGVTPAERRDIVLAPLRKLLT